MQQKFCNFRSDVGADGISHAEFYQLLSKATYCMREEYIKKLTKAKLEIKKRFSRINLHVYYHMINEDDSLHLNRSVNLDPGWISKTPESTVGRVIFY